MTFKAKLGTGNAPVVDLGTERHGRAVRKVNELRATYPDAHLLPEGSEESVTCATVVREPESVYPASGVHEFAVL